MTQPPTLTDTIALRRNRARALALPEPAMFLQQAVFSEIEERLSLVNRAFTKVAIVSPFPEIWKSFDPSATIVPDTDTLDLPAGAFDLVIHPLSMHWANDPVGQLVQSRRALRPDGMFLGALFGGQTLHELRSALAEAETRVTGGLSPRIAPMGEIRDLGALLQRAGFALPVADALIQNVTYRTPLALMRDLRAMGEANAMADRSRKPMPRALLNLASQLYQEHFPSDDDGIRATFELIFLTGWAPDASQPKPLRPGSASTRLAEALGTRENPLSDPARPGRV